MDSNNRRKHPNAEYSVLNTQNILFICGGSFEGIERIIASRLRSVKATSKSNGDPYISADELRSNITQADLVAFGFLPEFAARFNNIATLSSLDEQDLVKILTDTDNGIIREYEKYFEAENVELTFNDEAIKAIAQAAIREGTGARGLRSTLDKCLLDTLFHIPGRSDVKHCLVSKDTIEKQHPPEMVSQAGKPIVFKRNYVFISYSRKDLVWLEELKMMLSPLLRNKTIDVWFDGVIKPSQEWRKEIELAMAAAKVAVLLVSSHFLASEFAMKEELPYFLDMAKKREVKIIWILLSSCLYTETSIPNYQAAHNISVPLDKLTQSERQELWVQICQQIKSAVNQNN